jgi:uncharacterized protein YgiM (DUF1202 family)
MAPVVNASINIETMDQQHYEQLITTGYCSAEMGKDTCQLKLTQDMINNQYAVSDVSAKGFVVMLAAPATTDTRYSWNALAVKKPKTTRGWDFLASMQERPSDVASQGAVLGEMQPGPSQDPVPTPASASIVQRIIIGDTELGYLRMRSGPSTFKESVGEIPAGTIIDYVQKENGWYQIGYKGVVGWVSGEYADKTSKAPTTQATLVPTATPTPSVAAPSATSVPTVQPSPSPTSTPTPQPTSTPVPSPTIEPSANTITVGPTETGSLKIRSKSNPFSEDLGEVAVGTRLVFSEKDNGWYKILHQGIDGWVSGEYAKKDLP